jgi:hypothetical protein
MMSENPDTINMKKLLVFLLCFLSYTLCYCQQQLINFGNLHSFSGASISFFGNLVNNGTITDAGQSVSFQGACTHSISGASPTTLYNLTVDAGSSGITMQQDIQITNSLVLTSGSLNLNSKTLTINNSSSGAITRTSGYIVSEQTDNSGRIKWNIGTNTTAHIFPFGTIGGTYIPFTLTVTSGNIGNVTVSTYPTSVDNTPYPSTPTAVMNVSASGTDNSANVVDRFWQIDKDGTGGTATLIFTASPSEIGTMTSLKAQRWNSSTHSWDGPLAGQTSSATGVTVPGVSQFSPWTLSGNNVVLPVELMNFRVKAVGNNANLHWETATELNSDFFMIERSIDGSHFVSIERISAAGTSNQEHHYQYIDSNLPDGKYYYRLKETDLNKAINYSEVRSVDIVSTNEFQIETYPNPVSQSMFTIELPNSGDDKALITLFDIIGKSIAMDLTNTGDHSWQVHLPTAPAPGLYILKISTGNVKYEQTLVIQ